jgi:AcrR family transcriptional regulator
MSPAIKVPPRPSPDPYSDPVVIAMAEVAVERGYREATVAEVAERAGLSVAEFHQRFADKEDCAQRAWESFASDFEWRAGTAYSLHREWRSGLRAAAYTAADWMEAWPNVLRFGSVEILKMESEMVRVRREAVFVFCARLIEGGRAAAEHPETIPEIAPMVAIGSILHQLTHRLQKGEDFDSHEMAREMLYTVIRLFLGDELAREELSVPRPAPIDFDAL